MKLIDWVAIDWVALASGLAVGTVVSAVFFAGLALGMRIALRAGRPAAILLLSAGLRIALLLGTGWLVAQAGTSAFCGYAASFLLVRQLAINLARPRPIQGGSRWN